MVRRASPYKCESLTIYDPRHVVVGGVVDRAVRKEACPGLPPAELDIVAVKLKNMTLSILSFMLL